MRPEFRRRGIGRYLLEAALEAAGEFGYSAIPLDSVRFMKQAHATYRSKAFKILNPMLRVKSPRNIAPLCFYGNGVEITTIYLIGHWLSTPALFRGDNERGLG